MLHKREEREREREREREEREREREREERERERERGEREERVRERAFKYDAILGFKVQATGSCYQNIYSYSWLLVWMYALGL